MALAPGTRFGAYEVFAVLGAGGMGEVYRARDGRLNRDVALKILPAPFALDPGQAGPLQARGPGARVAEPPEHCSDSWCRGG